MPLPAGTKLGPYEILPLIGVGGMGEVYKARDLRLDRLVALKVSKAEFTERFKQEARLVAQLNHRNICTLHDVGPNFLVMSHFANLRMMTIDERVEALVMTAELHQKELEALRSYIQTDAENIRALVRVAEIHERRLETLEGDQP